MKNYAQARQHMLLGQLEPNRVSSPKILSAFNTIERDRFLPEELKGIAYADSAVSLGNARYLIEPRIFAKLLQEADLQTQQKVLDIACGTGFSTAILSQFCDEVYAVESVGDLSEVARKNLKDLGINAQLFNGSLTNGYTLRAPYDAIFIQGAVEFIPQPLVEQLRDGGKIYTLLPHENRIEGMMGTACCWTKNNNTLYKTILFDAAMPTLPEFKSRTEFSF